MALSAISPGGTTVAIAMVVLALGLAWGLGLPGWWRLLQGAAFAALQVGIMGVLLEVAFALPRPAGAIASLGLLSALAAASARGAAGNFWRAWGAIAGSAVPVGGVWVAGVLPPEEWFDPRYLVPVAATLLGAATASIAIGGERLARTFAERRQDLETHLCLGASPRQAIAPLRRQAIQGVMASTARGVATVAIVTVPGAMAGLLLAGTPPLTAAAYQLALLAAVPLTALLAVWLLAEMLWRQAFPWVAP